MSKPTKTVGANSRPQARLPKGFQDTSAEHIRAAGRMLDTIREVYERYGFEPLDPGHRVQAALGKFCPTGPAQRGRFCSYEDEQWLSLRYDLTAPLARYGRELRPPAHAVPAHKVVQCGATEAGAGPFPSVHAV